MSIFRGTMHAYIHPSMHACICMEPQTASQEQNPKPATPHLKTITSPCQFLSPVFLSMGFCQPISRFQAAVSIGAEAATTCSFAEYPPGSQSYGFRIFQVFGLRFGLEFKIGCRHSCCRAVQGGIPPGETNPKPRNLKPEILNLNPKA